MNKRITKQIKLVYSNVQGFTGKKTSVTEIVQSLDCDICMLVETMTTRVKVEDMKSICPSKSVGQNVAILVGSRLIGCPTMKLYEPNEDVNMLGIRVELAKNNRVRFFTAHLKQISANEKDQIRTQFEEIRSQFHNAAACREGMILICDANVHVGKSGIPLCNDKQDWAGAEFLEIMNEEGLYLVNGMDICSGVVTRIDPRNGTKSTIDLVVCNEFIIDEVEGMKIDEECKFRPTKYTKKKVTQTDHLTVMVDMKVNKLAGDKVHSYRNLNNEDGQKIFVEKIKEADFSDLFLEEARINEDYGVMMGRWDSAICNSFKLAKPSKNRRKGIDEHVKQLMNEERELKKQETS